MNEYLRKRLVEILQKELGLDPATIAQRDANWLTYQVFTGDVTEEGKATKTVFWTDEQIEIIDKYKDLFYSWFNDGTAVKNWEDSNEVMVLTIQELSVLLKQFNTKVYIVAIPESAEGEEQTVIVRMEENSVN